MSRLWASRGARYRFHARRRASERRRQQVAYRMMMLIIMLLTVTLATATTVGALTGITVLAQQDHADTLCVARMILPVRDGSVVRPYEQPPHEYAAGHRGVDIALTDGERTALIAPVDGTVSFAGSVAGKAVVSVTSGMWTVSFEPAVTALHVGDRVMRGHQFATARGGSDHCADTCVHWGVRENGTYTDPMPLLTARRIRLLPVTTP